MKNLHSQLLDLAMADYEAVNISHLKGAKIFVTGASGFLATSLLVFLSRLDRRNGLNLKLAASARRPSAYIPLFNFLDETPQVEWQQARVEDTVLPRGSWIVVHAASHGSPKDYLREPLETYSANVQGLIHLLGQKEHIRQFVYFSSAEIYGQASSSCIPTREDYVGGSQTMSVRSIYGESKRMAEVLGVCLTRQHQLPLTVLRPWNVYGPGQRLEDGRVPMEFVRQAKADGRIALSSDGSPTRSFCYVWDAIRQITSLLGHDEKQVAYNIGNGTEEISVLELARIVARACDLPDGSVTYDMVARSDSLQRCAPDVSRVTALESPKREFTPIETGLRTLVEWYQYLSLDA